MEQVWDPLRKKLVALTPEEKVRQWFIGLLRDSAQVPVHMMMSEVSLKVGTKPYRADIVVYDRTAKPLMVVECKRPDIVLNQAVIDQDIRYNRALEVRYIAVTNGPKTFLFAKEGDGFVFMEKAPMWEEMICKQ